MATNLCSMTAVLDMRRQKTHLAIIASMLQSPTQTAEVHNVFFWFVRRTVT